MSKNSPTSLEKEIRKILPDNKSLVSLIAKDLKPYVEAEFWSQYAGGGSDYSIKKGIKEDSEMLAIQILSLIKARLEREAKEYWVEEYEDLILYEAVPLESINKLLGDS